jgi:hypothetical protein
MLNFVGFNRVEEEFIRKERNGGSGIGREPTR